MFKHKGHKGHTKEPQRIFLSGLCAGLVDFVFTIRPQVIFQPLRNLKKTKTYEYRKQNHLATNHPCHHRRRHRRPHGTGRHQLHADSMIVSKNDH